MPVDIFGGGRTPDDFPGERIDESIKLLPVSGTLPSINGEIYYVTGSITGSGFFFFEEGTLRRLGGMDEFTHEHLNTLAHDEVDSSYDYVTYGPYGITNLTIWSDQTQAQKLQDYIVTYTTTLRLISSLTSSVYNFDGSLKARIIEVPTYDVRRRIVNVSRSRVFG